MLYTQLSLTSSGTSIATDLICIMMNGWYRKETLANSCTHLFGTGNARYHPRGLSDEPSQASPLSPSTMSCLVRGQTQQAPSRSRGPSVITSPPSVLTPRKCEYIVCCILVLWLLTCLVYHCLTGTQQDQDETDADARKKAMKELVQSWMDRLQLITVVVRMTSRSFHTFHSTGCDRRHSLQPQRHNFWVPQFLILGANPSPVSLQQMHAWLVPL